jgi:hypothetical protein
MTPSLMIRHPCALFVPSNAKMGWSALGDAPYEEIDTKLAIRLPYITRLTPFDATLNLVVFFIGCFLILRMISWITTASGWCSYEAGNPYRGLGRKRDAQITGPWIQVFTPRGGVLRAHPSESKTV